MIREWTTLMIGSIAIVAAFAIAAARQMDLEEILLSNDANTARQLNVFYSSGPRILQSYVNGKKDGFVYDVAVATIEAILRGRLDLGRSMADALLVLIDDDRFPNGHLHHGYYATDLHDPAGQYTSVKHPTVAPGNISWVAMALVDFYAATGEQRYLDGAIKAAAWIKDNCERYVGFGGYAGGFVGWQYSADETRITEHNIGVYVLARKLHKLTGDTTYALMADHAQRFVQSMFYEPGGYYLGGSAGGTSRALTPVPADVQAWALLSGIDDYERTNRAIDWAFRQLLVVDEVDGVTYHGIRWSTNGTHVQCEATAHVAAALWIDGRQADALWLMGQLNNVRLTAPNIDPDGIGIVATPWPQGAYTGYGSATYPNALHVGATVWLGLAAMVMQQDTAANPLCRIAGDATRDGVVNVLDMIFVRNHAGGDPGSDSGAAKADVSNDNAVNVLDMILVRNHLGDTCE